METSAHISSIAQQSRISVRVNDDGKEAEIIRMSCIKNYTLDALFQASSSSAAMNYDTVKDNHEDYATENHRVDES